MTVAPLLHQALGRGLRTALWVLWGVVAAVLLIACANVANLMLARAAAREKEIALRLALGARRRRVMRQLLAESIVLALLGGALGALLGWWGLRLIVAANPANIPRLNEVTLDLAVLGFTLGVSVLAGVLFGLAPAWHCSSPEMNEALKEGARAVSSGRAAGRTRDALVVAEVALSVVLLAGAGLMFQSFAQMLRADRGFSAGATPDRGTGLFSVRLHDLGAPDGDASAGAVAGIARTPSRFARVQAVGAGSRLLRRENGPPNESIAIFGRSPLRLEEQPRAEFKGITPDWVRALGGRVLRGRDLTEADRLEAPGAVLINETLARRYFPNEDPIGQRLKMGASLPPVGATNAWGLPQWSTIVGVVRDVKSLHPQPEAVPEVYQSYWQWPMQNPTLLIRTTTEPAMLAQAVGRETKAVIPNLPPPVVRTMDDLLSETVAEPRLQTGLVSVFAGLALLLAAVGLYGVLAYAVTQRTHEIGVRLALGAQKRNVLSLVIGHGMRLALAGLCLGLLCALALTRALSSLLYGVKPADPLTFAAVSLLLVAIALLACWLPARRAAKLDPLVALRYE